MDLRTTYMGMELSCPVVPSASPLSQDIAAIKQMEDAGAGAVVLWSLFEEQISHDAEELDHYLEYGADRFAESLSYFPAVSDYKLGPDEYLEHIRKAKEAVDMPVIASLNGVSTGGWIDYAKKMADAGADAIELNVYFLPTDPKVTAAQVETVYASILQAVKSSVSVPVAMKLSPYFSATANALTNLAKAGADALVMFNRFYQPNINIDELEVYPSLKLSNSSDNLLALRWIAVMYGKTQASLAATSGVHTARDVAKLILAGADVTMMCSALLLKGIGLIAEVRQGLEEYMQAKGYESVQQMKGVLSHAKSAEPGAFERANYMKALTQFGRTKTFE